MINTVLADVVSWNGANLFTRWNIYDNVRVPHFVIDAYRYLRLHPLKPEVWDVHIPGLTILVISWRIWFFNTKCHSVDYIDPGFLRDRPDMVADNLGRITINYESRFYGGIMIAYSFKLVYDVT